MIEVSYNSFFVWSENILTLLIHLDRKHGKIKYNDIGLTVITRMIYSIATISNLKRTLCCPFQFNAIRVLAPRSSLICPSIDSYFTTSQVRRGLAKTHPGLQNQHAFSWPSRVLSLGRTQMGYHHRLIDLNDSYEYILSNY